MYCIIQCHLYNYLSATVLVLGQSVEENKQVLDYLIVLVYYLAGKKVIDMVLVSSQ